jgi:predicted acyl esterase
VVKLIDVYPDEVPSQPELGGYQLGIAMDIFRGRYRNSLETPSPIPANEVQRYRFALPNANHVFLPGHRIMVQVQSSWFPLYDRNPQTYVPNIFYAKPADYQKATLKVFHNSAWNCRWWNEISGLARTDAVVQHVRAEVVQVAVHDLIGLAGFFQRFADGRHVFRLERVR